MNKSILLSIVLNTAAISSVGVWAEVSDSVLFVPSDQLDTYWIVEKQVAPEYPGNSLRKGEEGCVTVGFIIEPDGTTSNHRAVVAFPSNDFNKSGIEAARQFVYKPSEQNPSREAVFTSDTFTFQIQKSTEADEQKRETLASICTESNR
jgi:TonB family protein